MKSVGIRALKQNASAVVAEAAAGEEITITDRGRPVAVLVPVRSDRLDALVASGAARPATRSLQDLPPTPAGEPLTPDLLRDREAGRF